MNLFVKPFFRGRFHEAAAFMSLGAGVMLISQCHSLKQYLATSLYTLSLVGLFTISALYHRIQWGDVGRAIMRRLDHSAIFGLIAGTSTAVFMLSLNGDEWVKAVIPIWIASAIGILRIMFWTRAPKWFSAAVYIVTGWLAVPYLHEMGIAMGTGKTLLVLAGGIIYTAGAIVYALRRPNPWPRFFGYHEVFHVAVIIAAGLHFVVIATMTA